MARSLALQEKNWTNVGIGFSVQLKRAGGSLQIRSQRLKANKKYVPLFHQFCRPTMESLKCWSSEWMLWLKS